jgi:tRNA A37 threonylcarbamoyladenosine dehydratase
MAEDKMEDSLDDRRFGGVARLYGPELREHFRQATVVVAGLGGVGSWAAEALARTAI